MVISRCLLALIVASTAYQAIHAQGPQVSPAGIDPRAMDLIRAAVKAELFASQTYNSAAARQLGTN